MNIYGCRATREGWCNDVLWQSGKEANTGSQRSSTACHGRYHETTDPFYSLLSRYVLCKLSEAIYYPQVCQTSRFKKNINYFKLLF